MNDPDLTPEELERLRRLARRLQNDPTFLGYPLQNYKQVERLSDEILAQRLQTSPAMLIRMALCKCPDPDSEQFAAQVRQIADYTHSDASALAGVIRHQSVALKFRQMSTPKPEESMNILPAIPRAANLLAAARDRDELDETPPEETDTRT